MTDELPFSDNYGALHNTMSTRMRTGLSFGERGTPSDDGLPYSTDKGALHNTMSTRMRTGIFAHYDLDIDETLP